MKFLKVRNSLRISKTNVLLVIFFLLVGKIYAQQIPSEETIPLQNSTNLPVPRNTNQTLPGQNNLNPNVQNRTPRLNDPTNARNVELTPADAAAITREDSIRLVLETRENEDLALESLRRRIFGYKFFNQTVLDPNSAINIATPNNYTLGAGDVLVVDIYGYLGQDNQEVTVNPDGNITLRKAGVVKVGGLPISEARSRITSALGRVYIGLGNSTKVNVSLGNVRSIKVNIIGEVVAPGTYTMTSFSSLLNAMYACGGPNEIGTYREIKLIRENKVVAELDLYDIILNGSSKDNRLLQDQDIIQVSPIISRIAINGLSKRNGLFEMKNDESISKAIEFAGGFDKDAYTHRLKVYRNTARERKILDINYDNLAAVMAINGDSIVIDRLLPRFENLVTIEGAVFRGGEFSLESSPSLLKLIDAAEGLSEDALIGRISVVRTNDDFSLENFSVNLRDLRSGLVPDFELKRQDQVIVHSIFDLTEVASIRIAGAINNVDAIEGVELPYVKNMTLQDVLVRVGGLTEAASLKRIEIVRRKRNVDPSNSNAQISEIIGIDMSSGLDVLKADNNPVLQPYDQIFVRNSPNYKQQTFVEIQGEVLYPSVYGISTKEEKVSDIIQRSGGLTLQAYIDGATLIRTVELSEIELEIKRKAIGDLASSSEPNQVIKVQEIEPTQQQSIGIDLKKILANPGSTDDLIVEDGDIIRIPKVIETIRVQGEVLYPNTVKFEKGAVFKDYISHAGGFTRRSLRSRSYVIYANGSVDRTRKFLAFNVYPKIKPGSEIIIPERATNGAQQLSKFSSIVSTVGATMATLVSIIGIVTITR